MRRKKSHIFNLDVLFALLILLVGLTIIYYKFPVTTKGYYFNDQLSNDIISVLSETTIPDLCDDIDNENCNCSLYTNLTEIVCQRPILNYESDMLSLFSEGIYTKNIDPDNIKSLIKEIFVDKNVIDEKRFGFSLIYFDPKEDDLKELYNTDGNDNG